MIGTRSFVAKPGTFERRWYVVDADGKTLGRLAAGIAQRLRGKHKAIYTPGVDCGDFIVVTNSDHMTVTGNKLDDKKYYRHTGYVGNVKKASLGALMAKDSAQVLRGAVRGMLPRGPLGREQLRHLRIYRRGEHPHQSQKPAALNI